MPSIFSVVSVSKCERKQTSSRDEKEHCDRMYLFFDCSLRERIELDVLDVWIIHNQKDSIMDSIHKLKIMLIHSTDISNYNICECNRNFSKFPTWMALSSGFIALKKTTTKKDSYMTVICECVVPPIYDSIKLFHFSLKDNFISSDVCTLFITKKSYIAWDDEWFTNSTKYTEIKQNTFETQPWAQQNHHRSNN